MQSITRTRNAWRGCAALIVSGAASSAAAQDAPRTAELADSEPTPPTVTIGFDTTSDVVFRGTDTLQRMLDGLRDEGGIVEFLPGRYVLHATVAVPPDITLRGNVGAVIALPAPVRVRAAAAAGSRELLVSGTRDFAPNYVVQVLPHEDDEVFADGETRSLRFLAIESVTDDALVFAEPLPVDIPAGARVGYSHKLLRTTAEGRVTFERLAFDGGRVAGIPMPGHHMRTAVWAAGPKTTPGNPAPPVTADIVVRSCSFKNLYGRGVAFYRTVDCLVEASHFSHIADEAIDFDHYCERNRAVGNDIRDAWWGIVLNDAADCVIEYNNIESVRIGIWAWEWKGVDQKGFTRRNIVRHNFVRGATEAAISLDEFCRDHAVTGNLIEGVVRQGDASNVIDGNADL